MTDSDRTTLADDMADLVRVATLQPYQESEPVKKLAAFCYQYNREIIDALRAPGFAAGVEAALAVIRKREALDATQHDMLVALGMEIAALAPDTFRPLGFRDGVEAAAKVCDEAEAVERRAWDEFIASLNRGETQGPASSFAGLHSTMAKRIRALAPAVPEEQTALGDIAAERRRQIEAEGWTLAHDDEHDHGEMAMAAAAYAWLAGLHDESRAAQIRMQGVRHDGQRATINDLWPQHWSDVWFKPKDKRRDLVRAAALIVAEIERLDRAAIAALRGE